MSQRTKVTGTRSFTLWLLLFIAVVLVVGVAVGGLFILPQIQSQQDLEKHYYGLERRIRRAEDVEAAGGAPPGDGGDGFPPGDSARPGTFRYSDAELRGEVRTSVPQKGGFYSVTQAEVFRRDGTTDTVGTARYSVAGSEATLYSDALVAPNYAAEGALLQEVSVQARAQGADRLRVWLPADRARPWRARRPLGAAAVSEGGLSSTTHICAPMPPERRRASR